MIVMMTYSYETCDILVLTLRLDLIYLYSGECEWKSLQLGRFSTRDVFLI